MRIDSGLLPQQLELRTLAHLEARRCREPLCNQTGARRVMSQIQHVRDLVQFSEYFCAQVWGLIIDVTGTECRVTH